MARVDSRTLFLTTSPRTPMKMVPEISLLNEHFAGQPWNSETQIAFMDILRDENYFNGKGEKDPAFSARDRINRAPKALGFVSLSPTIALTPAGQALVKSKRQEEVFLRQLIKFQVPSPLHKPSKKAARFCIKPYLEMLRMVRTLGTLKFDELQIFGMQLTDWHNFERIVGKIKKFRIAQAQSKQSYRLFKATYLHKELSRLYADRITSGDTKTRESKKQSTANFLRTQSNNMRDYADACFRYLRATGLVQVSHVGKSLSIVPDRIKDVDYILDTVDRKPCFIDDEKSYANYLGDISLPKLLTDSKERVIERLKNDFPNSTFAENADIEILKDLLNALTEKRKTSCIETQVKEIKDYKLYNEIQATYQQIADNTLYDAPLMLEWNTWRAMTMLDGGKIEANLNFDDYGKPLSTAQGNMADIVCGYGDYMLSVEVTMASGQRQYEMEGEPVSRHLGKLKSATGKPCYCLFLAPTINEACIAHFYALHSMNISYYGGRSIIVPLPLHIFQKMLEDSYQASYTPKPQQVRQLFEHSRELAKTCTDETEWFEKIQKAAMHWIG